MTTATTTTAATTKATNTATASKPSLPVAFLEVIGIMLFRFPIKWRLWILLMMLMNFLGLFLFDGVEVQVIFAVVHVEAFAIALLYQQLGFVKLLGIGHVGWFFMLPWLYVRLDGIDNESVLYKWLVGVIVIDGLSLILDVADVYSYYKGNRKPTLVWREKVKE